MWSGPIKRRLAHMQTIESELKIKHRAMWASGDYPQMVETFLIPIGERLAAAAPIEPGTRVLDVASGTGNAAIPAAARGGEVTASDLTPELLEAGSQRPGAEGIEWVTADAEELPFADESYDVVMSAIGVMFAPHHQASADELVRVTRPGGTIALLSWTPEGMLGALFATMKEFAAPPPPGAQSPPLWGSEEHLAGLFGGRVSFHTLDRETLEITAFPEPRDYAAHFKAYYGPTIAVRANAVKNGREAEFDAALDRFCEEWDRNPGGPARFDKEYLLAIGTRA
jgi:SAM-dependent methyltransferase